VIRALPHYLWKEWRDQRVVALGFLIAAPAVLGLTALLLPRSLVADPVFPSITALACFGVVLFSIGSDLVPGEARRDRLRFLLRMPAGLGAAFLAKVLFLALATAFFSVYGYVLAGLLGEFPGRFDSRVADLAPVAVAFAAWVFVASCWLPRGALAVPAAALFLAVVGLPVYLLAAANPGVEWLLQMDLRRFIGLAVAAALLVAWLSFVRGYRFGRGPGSAALRGLLASLVLAVPAWAHAHQRVQEWTTVVPGSDRLHIEFGWVGEGGRFAFVNARTMLSRPVISGPWHALVIDLETGEWRQAGRPDETFTDPLRWGRSWDLGPVPYVRLPDHASREEDAWWIRYFDGATGEVFKSGWSNMRLPEVEERAIGLRPDVPEGARLLGPCGLGFAVSLGGKLKLHDPYRGKTYDPGNFAAFRNLTVRPGRWLARRERRWGLLDPESKDWKPLPDLGTPALMPDGRLVHHEGTTLAVFDPDSGERRDLYSPVTGFRSIGLTPGGAPVLLLRNGDEIWVARLDPVTLELSFTQYVRVLGIPDEESLIGAHGGRVVRARFGNRTVETLWPRGGER
jgi:hypothetical protein